MEACYIHTISDVYEIGAFGITVGAIFSKIPILQEFSLMLKKHDVNYFNKHYYKCSTNDPICSFPIGTNILKNIKIKCWHSSNHKDIH